MTARESYNDAILWVYGHIAQFLPARPPARETSAVRSDVGSRYRVLARVERRVFEQNKGSETETIRAHGAPGSSEANGRDSGEGSV